MSKKELETRINRMLAGVDTWAELPATLATAEADMQDAVATPDGAQSVDPLIARFAADPYALSRGIRA